MAEGIRAVEELVRAGVPIRGALVTAELAEGARGRALREALDARASEVAEVTSSELATAADTDSPQGVVAIAEVPSYELETLKIDADAVLLVLDGIQDPGNAGTILRTAAALGATASIALPGTVDLWNPKVVRGAMGAHFTCPAIQTPAEELFSFMDRHDIALWATDVQGEPIETAEPPARVALVVGNEGSGLSDAVRARAARTVGLEIAAGVESLNVAVATGVFLYFIRKKRRDG